MNLINKVTDFVKQPYSYSLEKKNIPQHSLIITAIITFILLLGIPEVSFYPLLELLGYSLITLSVCISFFLFFPGLFPRWFDEEEWTVGREIVSTLFLLFTIGSFNYFFNSVLSGASGGILVFIDIQLSTMLIAVLPVIFVIYIEQNRHLKKKLVLAIRLNKELSGRKANPTEEIISLSSENQKERIDINLDKLLFIKSSSNYVEIFNSDNIRRPKLLRNTLKNIEEELKEYGSLIRCHRAYIINLNKIKNVKGNSQGYSLEIEETDQTVPVSRGYSKSFSESIRRYVN